MSKSAEQIKETKKAIAERIELLEGLSKSIEGGSLPMMPIGSLVDDLYIVSPLTNTKVIPFILELYKEERRKLNAPRAVKKG